MEIPVTIGTYPIVEMNMNTGSLVVTRIDDSAKKESKTPPEEQALLSATKDTQKGDDGQLAPSPSAPAVDVPTAPFPEDGRNQIS